MAVRYQRARLFIAAGIAVSVIAGTGYFAGTTPASSTSDTSGSSTSTTVEAPKAPTKVNKAKKSRGS